MVRPSSIADYARLFASLGGKARKRALTPEERRAIAKKGGEARRKALSAAQRRASARKAVLVRWAKAKKKS